MNKQSGFTLLELVIAMAIFALLGLASWGLFDGVVRVQRGTTAHEREFRSLQRAVAVIERDVLHATDQPVVLQQSVLQLQRSHWRNPLDQPRSERQLLTIDSITARCGVKVRGRGCRACSGKSCWAMFET